MYLRQIALVAYELEPVKQQLFALLGIESAFADKAVAQFGLHNIVMTLGQTFLEVVSPLQDETTAGRLLQRRKGDGGYMVIVQADDLARERDRLAGSDIEIVWQADSGQARAMHLHPRDVPGAIASIDQMTPPEQWYWAGPDWPVRAASRALALTAAEIQSDDPHGVAERWSLAYARPLQQVQGIPTLQLDRGRVRFVHDADGRGPGLRAIDIQVADVALLQHTAEQLSLPWNDDSVMVCGTELKFFEL